LNDDFQRVNSKIDLLQIITHETGLSLQGDYLERCPFCDQSSSFSINQAAQTYSCSSCNRSGDIRTFIAERFSMPDDWVDEKLAELAGELSPPDADYVPADEARESAREAVFRLARDHFRRNIEPEDSPGREWFCGVRGHAPLTLAKMQVGFSTGQLMPFLQENDFSAAVAVKYGLARDKDRNENPIPPKDYFWKGLVLFPVMDIEGGKVISFTCKDPSKKVKGLQLAGRKKDWFLNFPALAKYDELFLVEGENEIASFFDIGLPNVIGTAGEPSKEQITLLKNFCAGKTIFPWFDLDKQKNFRKETGGPSHTRKIIEGLRDENVTIKVVTHPLIPKKNGEPAEDPDDFIQTHLQSGKPATEVKQIVKDLAAHALDPVAWEISRLAYIEDMADKLAMFKERGLPRAINLVPGAADKEILIDMAAKTIGMKVSSIEEIVVKSIDLYKHLVETYESEKGIKNADAYALALRIFHWFNNGAGAKFFKTKNGNLYLFYNKRMYELDDDQDFNALMMQLTHLTLKEKPGPQVWDYLKSHCNVSGELVDVTSWIFTDKKNDIIYLNLNSAHNKILKLAPNAEPQMIDNGTNDQSIILSSSLQISTFKYLPAPSEAEGFRALKTLIMDPTPTEIPQRYFLLCWTISAFLIQYQSDRGLMHITGGTGLGKTKVCERISVLLYGESYVGRGTTPASTRMALNNPMVYENNLENRDLTKDKVEFLLFLADGTHKPKAKTGSDTEIWFQKLNSLGMSNGIEAFPGKYAELINRTWPLILDRAYRKNGYMHDATLGDIRKNRDLMLSTIFRMITHKVLPRLDRRRFWSEYLQSRHAGHNKERNNEHLTMIITTLEAVLEYLPLPGKEDQPIAKQAELLADRWITYHEDQAREAEITSNTLLTLMDGLAQEIIIKIRGNKDGLDYQHHPEFEDRIIDPEKPDLRLKVKVYQDPEYLHEFFLTEPYEALSEESNEWMERYQRLEFIIHSAQLHTILNRYSYRQGSRNPYENAYALGSRTANDHKVMKQGGWEYVQGKDKDKLTYKRSAGKDWWRFSKKINPIM